MHFAIPNHLPSSLARSVRNSLRRNAHGNRSRSHSEASSRTSSSTRTSTSETTHKTPSSSSTHSLHSLHSILLDNQNSTVNLHRVNKFDRPQFLGFEDAGEMVGGVLEPRPRGIYCLGLFEVMDSA